MMPTLPALSADPDLARATRRDLLREIERLREALKDARQRGGDFAAVWAVVTDALGDG